MLQALYFDENSPGIFPNLFPVKTDRNKTLLKKKAPVQQFLSKYGEILEQIFEQSAWKSRYI
jgi:hypothetical protein